MSCVFYQYTAGTHSNLAILSISSPSACAKHWALAHELCVLPIHHWNTLYSCHTFHFLSPSASAKHLTLAHKLNVLHYATWGQPVFCLTFSLSYLSLWQVLDLNPCSQAKCSIIMLPGPSYLFAFIFTIYFLLVPQAGFKPLLMNRVLCHFAARDQLSLCLAFSLFSSSWCQWQDSNRCSWLNCSTIMLPGPSYLFILLFHYFPHSGASGWIWTLATRPPGSLPYFFTIFFSQCWWQVLHMSQVLCHFATMDSHLFALLFHYLFQPGASGWIETFAHV